jgi:hypothetical protein
MAPAPYPALEVSGIRRSLLDSLLRQASATSDYRIAKRTQNEVQEKQPKSGKKLQTENAQEIQRRNVVGMVWKNENGRNDACPRAKRVNEKEIEAYTREDNNRSTITKHADARRRLRIQV